jgi:pimeloyl-ACP methyl ester carboxylesterase
LENDLVDLPAGREGAQADSKRTRAKANWWMCAVSVICLVVGIALSRRIEPGVRVESVMLAGDTPALRFLPADGGPHPVALLAHGITASKESLFRFGEALAAAGFVCFAVDLPGHGESRRLFSLSENAPTLTAIARELGRVDVFIGHSMGAGAGAESVRNGGLDPGLFIAVGAAPNLGKSGPRLLLLEGTLDEALPRHFQSSEARSLPLSTNQFDAAAQPPTDARLMLFPGCDHAFEPYDPRLVNAAVEAACATVGKTPPTAPTRWLWRLAGLVLALPTALMLALRLPEIFHMPARLRGPLLSIVFIAAAALASGTWVDAAPNPRRVPVQIVAMILFWLVLACNGKLRIPRWSFVAVAAVVAVSCALTGAYFLGLLAGIGAIGLLTGAALGEIATRRGSQRDGNLAMAIFIGYAVGQWMPTMF